MSKKSTGQFLAVLRKANGMTQQEVADRLNVSNKAVSRWEREECAPDISLIPALAEMFGVTCDEILRGERISEHTTFDQSTKIEKQMKTLMNRTISKFTLQICAAIAVAVLGLICMFGISYGFYRPIIGFSILLIFVSSSVALTIIAIIKMKSTKNENELFETAEEMLINRFNKTLGELSFLSFFVSVSAVIGSFPMIMFSSSYLQSVLSFESYIVYYIPIIISVLVLIYFGTKKAFISKITGVPSVKSPKSVDKTVSKMNLLQLGAILVAVLLFVFAPYFALDYESFLPDVLQYIGLAFIIVDIVCFPIFILRFKEKKNQLFLIGIRNLLLSIPAFLMIGYHSSGWTSVDEFGNDTAIWHRYDIWFHEYLLYSVIITLAIFAIFKIFEKKRTF